MRWYKARFTQNMHNNSRVLFKLLQWPSLCYNKQEYKCCQHQSYSKYKLHKSGCGQLKFNICRLLSAYRTYDSLVSYDSQLTLYMWNIWQSCWALTWTLCRYTNLLRWPYNAEYSQQLLTTQSTWSAYHGPPHKSSNPLLLLSRQYISSVRNV